MRLSALLLPAALLLSGPAISRDAAASSPEKPTIILVHGAFAESSSWNPVIARLEKDGYTVIAAANPLRGVASDATTVSSIVKSIKGPVVLVGHSYGGPVITAAANSNGNIKALVYLAALQEPSRVAAWKMLPSYMIYGTADRNIPPAVMKFMAERAHARKTVEVPGASHALMVSHPAEVAALIEDAAAGE